LCCDEVLSAQKRIQLAAPLPFASMLHDMSSFPDCSAKLRASGLVTLSANR
jgi:hypothetical protein